MLGRVDKIQAGANDRVGFATCGQGRFMSQAVYP